MNDDTVTVDTDEDYTLISKTAMPVNDDTFDKEDICNSVMNYAAAMEVDNPEAICAQAVDTTLRYVVGWLYERGNTGLAEILEGVGDLA